MGLAERRAVEWFKNEGYPGWQAAIDEAVGFAVPVEVKWEDLRSTTTPMITASSS